jgi:DNA-directed RNA polymerase specialized sigma24 family protein
MNLFNIYCVMLYELNEKKTHPYMDFNDNIETKGRGLKYPMDNLPPIRRKALHMRYYKKLSYQDMCNELNLDLQSVKGMIYESLRILRKNLKSISASSE